jgi:hypothetical protein
MRRGVHTVLVALPFPTWGPWRERATTPAHPHPEDHVGTTINTRIAALVNRMNTQLDGATPLQRRRAVPGMANEGRRAGVRHFEIAFTPSGGPNLKGGRKGPPQNPLASPSADLKPSGGRWQSLVPGNSSGSVVMGTNADGVAGVRILGKFFPLPWLQRFQSQSAEGPQAS